MKKYRCLYLFPQTNVCTFNKQKQQFKSLHCVCVCVRTHIFAPDLFLSELHLYQRSDCCQELPPWPIFDTTILLDILLDAADGHILDLSNTHTSKQIHTTIPSTERTRD